MTDSDISNIADGKDLHRKCEFIRADRTCPYIQKICTNPGNIGCKYKYEALSLIKVAKYLANSK